MPKFIVPGRLDPQPVEPLLARHVAGITKQESVTLDASRGAQEAATLKNAECVEVELSAGIHLWTRSDDLARDLGSAGRSGDDAVMLPRTLSTSAQGRDDKSELAIKTLKTFNVDLPGAITDFIASRVERGMENGGRLHQCSTVSGQALAPAAPLAGDGPTLLFLHGTASSTEGSFGGLWEGTGSNRVLRINNPGARINDLFALYGGRVLAFQHRSLTESPITNVAALVEQLAAVLRGGRELHIVSHSRGGLLGELLCRGMRTAGAPFDDVDRRAFAGRDAEAERLDTIGRILAEQQYRITRFVRVACPAAGTTLADGRLDRYVSVLLNVAGAVSGLAGNPAYEGLAALLAAVLKERTDPASLPGLEAMMPLSPLSKMLNRRDVETSADLHVLGGDLAVTGFLSALKALATDFYYLQDHDLVVNTRSMLRGIPRKSPPKYWIDTGGEVSHFNYFQRADTASRLVDALAGREADDEFHTLTVKPYEVDANSYRKRAADGTQPTVVVIPGLMGAHLANAGRVWLDATRIATGGLGLLADGQPAQAVSLVAAYGPLISHLAATHDVSPLPYDWRLSAIASAERLAQRLEALLPGAEASGQPIRLLAHASGGLVVQALIATRPDLWSRMCAHPGARAVLLGVPAKGSHRIAAMLAGRDLLVEGLAALDMTRTPADIRALLADLDGVLELVPDDVDLDSLTSEGGSDLDDETKERRRRKRAAARAVRERLAADGRLDPARISCVSGSADLTPAALRLDAATGQLVVDGTREGDGQVTWASSIPEALRPQAYHATVDHLGLVTSPDLFAPITDLLATGSTNLLRKTDPAKSAAPAATVPIPPRAIQIVPSDEELIASAFGSDRVAEAKPAPTVRVRVVHGNLSRAKSPVLIGHYEQDLIVSAEGYLDRQLDGRLTELRQLRLYPGPIETSAVVVNHAEQRRPSDHPGAIVVGLGVVGELTPGSLLATLERGLTAYGAERTADARRRPEAADQGDGGIVKSPVTSLLVGSGEGGVSLRDSVYALLRAVVRANERLARSSDEDRAAGAAVGATAFIDSLEIFDLFEDRAIEASRLINAIALLPEFSGAFVVERFVKRGAEAQQRAAFGEQAGWWQRLRVTEQDPSIDAQPSSGRRQLKYESLTERARIDAYTVSGLRQAADIFIDEASGTTAADAAIGRTLFQMLIPPALKERAPDRRDMVLLLDAAAAAIPWELFENGFDSNARPLAVESGMIRQLVDRYARHDTPLAIGNTALVIGNPPMTDPRFRPLQGASEEARACAALLAGPYRVESLIDEDATPRHVLEALYRKPWRILHLATHGVVDFVARSGAKVTGAVLSDDLFLEPSNFSQMPYVPELVFLNCCHLGSSKSDARLPVPRYPELAANIAMQFIKMGSRAVVAAGWAVDDAAARVFAETLYGAMLRGVSFGDASLRARQEIYERFPSRNTWGAYQCYGDPGFSLGSGRSDGGVSSIVCDRELWLQADRIASEAKTADGDREARLLASLRELVNAADPSWLDDARGAMALGAAYGELKQFQAAIDYYEKARQTERADITLIALEQLANLKGRFAEHDWHEGTKDADCRKAVDARFSEAQHLLETLITIAPTAERFALLGGLHKRRTMAAADNAAATAALTDMIKAYEHAYERKVERGASDPWYPLINIAAAQLARGWRKGKGKSRVDARTRQRLQDERVRLTKDAANGFWEVSFLVDLELIEALSGGKVTPKSRDELVARYRRARLLGGSAREFDSVVSQIRFLRDMAAAWESRPDLATWLTELIAALQQES